MRAPLALSYFRWWLLRERPCMRACRYGYGKAKASKGIGSIHFHACLPLWLWQRYLSFQGSTIIYPFKSLH
jgi:hypothetical protein